MKQKIIIGFSVALLLLAVFLIARDLFHIAPSDADSTCCGDEFSKLKKIDSSQVGYIRTRVLETNLKELSGIAINESHQVFVCGDRQVTAFDTAGAQIFNFVIDSAATGIAVSGNEVYIGSGPRILHYNLTTKKLDSWKPYNPSGYITALAVNENLVYAADAVSKRVLKYSPDGRLMLEIGKKDSLTEAPGFVLPSLYFDLAFGDYNDLWVANAGRLLIENYTTEGHMQLSWGRTSGDDNGFSGCCNPAHFTVLPDGGFVTYEKGIDKIKAFDPTGRFICFVAGAGYFRGNADFLLGNNNLVKDLTSDASGNLYVLDAYNRINIFRKTSNL
jgi:hypothetical protein